jgi:hypothetical protein
LCLALRERYPLVIVGVRDGIKNSWRSRCSELASGQVRFQGIQVTTIAELLARHGCYDFPSLQALACLYWAMASTHSQSAQRCRSGWRDGTYIDPQDGRHA